MPELLTDTMRKTIGGKIRTYREESGLSLRAFATITNTGHSWLAKLEKGQINFEIDSLTKLLESLQVHPRELFKFDLPYGDA